MMLKQAFGNPNLIFFSFKFGLFVSGASSLSFMFGQLLRITVVNGKSYHSFGLKSVDFLIGTAGRWNFFWQLRNALGKKNGL